jgi:dissimilatory sulfite reductase (desulfoviridin) alpha/beta subunit
MQRIKILGGRINWPQWRKVAELVEKYSPGTPLHITTRQDIELHNIREEDLPAVHQGFHRRSTSSRLRRYGAKHYRLGCELCEDIPIWYHCRICPQPNQQAITFASKKIQNKFSSCRNADTRPWLNDLAFSLPNGSFAVILRRLLGLDRQQKII